MASRQIRNDAVDPEDQNGSGHQAARPPAFPLLRHQGDRNEDKRNHEIAENAYTADSVLGGFQAGGAWTSSAALTAAAAPRKLPSTLPATAGLATLPSALAAPRRSAKMAAVRAIAAPRD
eukprot:CAMPEP_0179230554 /NCGR_PEP_ID=MMETSP0797-20121207/10893_1 /TAXON_ID=47934 /ORGANISM="Dinophysis acuminata, Strain DAEP01" /LENGTH=119 /DNA_ID=CAMNT_0020937625 /DNA_START=125 /DNA_END=485 /DNA_ORIENTATION=+